jgi:site-specific recombinase XerD
MRCDGATCTIRKTALIKRTTCHTVQQSFVTHLLECGYDIVTVRELFGYKDVKTTMV